MAPTFSIEALFSSLKTEPVFDFKGLPVVNGEDPAGYFDILKHWFQAHEGLFYSHVGCFYELPYLAVPDLTIDKAFYARFDRTYLQSHRFIPVFSDALHLYIAVDNPFNPILPVVEAENLRPVKVFLVSESDLDAHFGFNARSGDNPLDRLLGRAIEKAASDIHLSKEREVLTVSFRVHGQMQTEYRLAGDEEAALISLLKLHGGMDITAHFLPQDGRLSFGYQNQTYDIRVASMPTLYGEDFVLRLFRSDQVSFQIPELGFSDRAESMLKSLLSHKSGLILVTGPTGSGKTTTLYAMLSQLSAARSGNIVTLEDPVEHTFPGIRQSQINRQAGYTFSVGLRAVLRQDPDILMIGEIRDQETAKIAVHAAYTGHLVLSTLHTTDVRSTLLRLSSFELDPFLVGHALKGIVSQRLMSRNCLVCTAISGCAACGYTGKAGRVVLSEILEVTKPYLSRDSVETMTQLCDTEPYYSFDQDARYKRDLGIISEKDLVGFLGA